jgi:hypothetical protein
VNDPILGAHLLGVFTTIWVRRVPRFLSCWLMHLSQALYYIAGKSDSKIIAGGKTDEDGLSL